MTIDQTKVEQFISIIFLPKVFANCFANSVLPNPFAPLNIKNGITPVAFLESV